MTIRPIGGSQGTDKTDRVGKVKKSDETKATGSKSDSVEISPVAKLTSEMKNISPVRDDVVKKLQDEIDSGKFDVNRRLPKALKNFLQENNDIVTR